MKKSKFSEIHKYETAPEACRGSPGRRVESRGTPLVIRLDNGSELLATKFITCCERRGKKLHF
jgi:hypothetical protein